MKADVLVADGVGFQVKDSVILKSVSLTLSENESFALVGHNGAGKTTLFHLILGLKFRTEGSLVLAGYDVERAQARHHVGFVPERPYLNLDLTFRRALTYFGELNGMFGSDLRQKVVHLAQEMNLEEVMDRPLKTYSKGMLQKTLIAQALIHDPKLLVLDEPMSGLDVQTREFLKQKMKQWRAQGKALLFSSHVIEDVLEIADRVGVIEQGRLTFVGPVDQWSAGK